MENNFGAKKTGYDNLYPVFSFRNFIETKYFNEADILNKREFYHFFINIQKLSNKTWREIKLKPSQFHFHEITDDKNIHSKLSLSEEIDVIQFKLPADREARIIGYFDSDNVFNIVTYDYRHQIYPRN